MNSSLEVRHAIFAGIAAPAILLNIVAGVSDHPTRTKRTDLFGFSAFAQEGGPSNSISRAVIVQPTVSGGIPSASLPVTADVENKGKTEKRRKLDISPISVPLLDLKFQRGTSKIFIYGKEVPIFGSVTNVEMSIKTKPTLEGDFLWALGVPRSYSIQGIELAKPKPGPGQ